MQQRKNQARSVRPKRRGADTRVQRLVQGQGETQPGSVREDIVGARGKAGKVIFRIGIRADFAQLWRFGGRVAFFLYVILFIFPKISILLVAYIIFIL
jgi:hypothetical protein